MSDLQSGSSNENDNPSSPIPFYFLISTVGLALLTGLWMLLQSALF